MSLRPLSLPDGSQRLCARRTIEDWWYDYQHGGFAALTPKVRADKGQPRTLTPQQQKWILEQAQAHLAVPVKVLYRRWRGQDPQLPALNSIYRFLREHELHTKARRQRLRQPLGGATKCFEAPFVNDLVSQTRQRGTLLEERGGLYRFIHLSFQEFLTARHLAENKRDPEEIARFFEGGPILDSWWCEPALLLVGYLDVNAPSQGRLFLMRLAGLVPWEKVLIANINNGERMESYVIEGRAGSGVIALNGATARRGSVGDKVIILAFAHMEQPQAVGFKPLTVLVDKDNKPVKA